MGAFIDKVERQNEYEVPVKPNDEDCPALSWYLNGFYRDASLPAGHFVHIAKLNGRVCGAKRPRSVFKRPIYTMSE